MHGSCSRVSWAGSAFAPLGAVHHASGGALRIPAPHGRVRYCQPVCNELLPTGLQRAHLNRAAHCQPICNEPLVSLPRGVQRNRCDRGSARKPSSPRAVGTRAPASTQPGRCSRLTIRLRSTSWPESFLHTGQATQGPAPRKRGRKGLHPVVRRSAALGAMAGLRTRGPDGLRWKFTLGLCRLHQKAPEERMAL